jgi:hypothetical protein
MENALVRKRTVCCSKGDLQAKMPRMKDKLQGLQRKGTVPIEKFGHNRAQMMN